jgi:hypothetical protein
MIIDKQCVPGMGIPLSSFAKQKDKVDNSFFDVTTGQLLNVECTVPYFSILPF